MKKKGQPRSIEEQSNRQTDRQTDMTVEECLKWTVLYTLLTINKQRKKYILEIVRQPLDDVKRNIIKQILYYIYIRLKKRYFVSE